MHINPKKTTATKVVKVIKETFDITTLELDINLDAKPGQYVMVWIPGIDEIPMSLSSLKDPVSITIRNVGDATRSLSLINEGDKVGIRGPFGNGYTLLCSKPMLIGGGTGIASLLPLAEKLIEKDLKPAFLIGARSKNQLLFINKLKKIIDNNNLYVATDDGTEGFKGYASNYLFEILKEQNFDIIYTCGPELMMFKIFQIAEQHNILLQASMERYCKCAVGICGSCAMGPYRVCKDGPVFTSEMLRKVDYDFGKFKLDPSGRKIPVDH